MKEYRKLDSYPIKHWDIVFDEVFCLSPEDSFFKHHKDLGDLTTRDLALACHRSVPEVEDILQDICLYSPESIEIEVKDFLTCLKTQEEGSSLKLLILDLRERDISREDPFPQAIHLQSIHKHELPDVLKASTKIIFICEHGIRSYSAAMHFRKKGFAESYSLRGGLVSYKAATQPRTL